MNIFQHALVFSNIALFPVFYLRRLRHVSSVELKTIKTLSDLQCSFLNSDDIFFVERTVSGLSFIVAYKPNLILLRFSYFSFRFILTIKLTVRETDKNICNRQVGLDKKNIKHTKTTQLHIIREIIQ